MSQQNSTIQDPTLQMPSRSGLLLRVVVAIVIASLLVVCAVLPAEYRIDPTGFGRLTGLLDLTTPRVTQTNTTPAAAAPEPKPDASAKAATTQAATVDANGNAVPVVVKVSEQVARIYPGTFRTDTVKIPIKPDGELEYKVQMKPGATLMYSWQTDQGTVYYDFHGEPADPTKSQSYLEVQETASAHGTLVAPFEGIHGWFWLNLTSKPMVITLKMSGFYELRGVIK